MEVTDGSPPPSLCLIRADELFPKVQMEKDDIQLTVPYQELAGESVKYLGRTDDGLLALSNYRLFLKKNTSNVDISIPLGLIESAQTRDLFHLMIYCKDASTVKCSFETAEQCTEWHRRLQLSIGVPDTLESIFAFPFCSWSCDTIHNNVTAGGGGGGDSCFNNGQQSTTLGTTDTVATGQVSVYQWVDYGERLQRCLASYDEDFMRETERLGFDLDGAWRISQINEDFKLCPSYPPKILVPCCISDDTLQNVANFRASRRLPAVVWRHRKSGAVIARCSQPEVGWLGWRNTKDEQLLKALADACAFDRGEQMRCMNTQQATDTMAATAMTNGSNEGFSNLIADADDNASTNSAAMEDSHEEVPLDEVRKILIVDARSYTSAVTNRARGGGCECIEYYPCAEIEFMNLSNIHVIRKSFHALRQLCASSPDVPNWLGLLEKTMWLQHLSGLLAASMTVCHAIEKKGRPVLVHCSDGWDRTPQIVATAQLCLDPFYRTIDGFRILVEREWLSYGHKFADRCGHGPGSEELNERCPVFLQWLDLVHQIHKQFSCSFEFSMGYLIKLAQHSHSGLFGTFLCNTLKERIENSVFERTFSVWPFLSGHIYRNPLYIPNKDRVLWPAYNVRDLSLWTEVYLDSLGGNQNSIDIPACINDNQMSINCMSKTRSYGDLITAGIIMSNGLSRRSSDPNVIADPNLTIGFNSENNSITDLLHTNGEQKQLDNNHHTKHNENVISSVSNESSPQILTNFIYHTTKQLELLTSELNKPLRNDDNQDVDSKEADNHDINRLKEKSINSENGLNLTKQQTAMTNGSKETNSKDPIDKDYGNVYIKVSRSLSPTANISNDNHSSEFHELTTQWHGSVNTSTDTLVPLNESNEQSPINSNTNCCLDDNKINDTTDGILKLNLHQNCSNSDNKIQQNCKELLPKIHSHQTKQNNFINTTLMTSAMIPITTATATINTTTTSLSMCNITEQQNGYDCFRTTDDDNNLPTTTTATTIPTTSYRNNHQILPESKQFELTIIGRHDDRPVAGGTISEATARTTSASASVSASASASASLSSLSSTAACNYNLLSLGQLAGSNLTSQRRRRTHSTNSKRNALIANHLNSRFPISGGVRSLPMTPPSLQERPPIALSCPDGLGHALSEENLRLQQIVHEHKLREDVLLREIHDMRVALLKKICPSCNNATTTGGLNGVAANNDEQGGQQLNQSENQKQKQNQNLDGYCRRCRRLYGKQIEQSLRDILELRYYYEKTTHNTYTPDYTTDDDENNDDNDDDDDQIHHNNIKNRLMAACSTLDNVENISVSSWEAVEEQRGGAGTPSSSSYLNSSSNPMNANNNSSSSSSVLWVPDHAVSCCTTCQTVFSWVLRRHHCRSCGQIFCADCSEFWAPLPDEKLFSPVRLCGPCYHKVTMRMHLVSCRRVHNNFDLQYLFSSYPSNLEQEMQQQQYYQRNCLNFKDKDKELSNMVNSSNNNNDGKSLNATETLPATTTAFGAIRMPVTKTFASVAMSAPTNGGLSAKSLEKSCCSSSNTNSTTISTTSSSSSTMKISQHLQQHQQQNQCAAASLKANGSNATTAAATATN